MSSNLSRRGHGQYGKCFWLSLPSGTDPAGAMSALQEAAEALESELNDVRAVCGELTKRLEALEARATQPEAEPARRM